MYIKLYHLFASLIQLGILGPLLFPTFDILKKILFEAKSLNFEAKND